MKKTARFGTALGMLLGLAVAGVAVAASGAPSFDAVDTNKDGKISKEEAAKVKKLDFAKADTNSDGVLSRAEYDAAVG